MNYPEELRERYNEVMYDERDIPVKEFSVEMFNTRNKRINKWSYKPTNR